MQANTVQAMLAGVEKPSRYLGTEINRVVKNPGDAALRMVLAFPDLYEIGSSHFGIQILYHLLNRCKDIAVERVFAPAKDMEAALRKNNMTLCSLENQTPLRQFPIIGFSLLYELNYTNVLNMLDLAGIPLYAEQRGEEDPFVIGGGPCVSNPEPMAPFFDAMVFGDGERVLPQMADTWIAWKSSGGHARTALLYQWAQLEGVYIPGFFKADHDEDGFQRLIPIHPEHTRVRRTIVHDLDAAFFPDHPIIAFGKPVHDRLRLEISRGCSRGCRFCQAGMIYRPVRERSMQTLLDITERSLAATGYEDLSLLSLSTGDYCCLSELMEKLMQRSRYNRVAVSLPSIRAGTLTPVLMQEIKKVRKTGFTIAPEAGSQRLRDVINKNICFDDIQATVADAFALGWQVIKLYFMIGLPTESDADLDAIAQMVADLKRIKGPAKRRGQINVSVTTFIPKAHTPFQWVSQIRMDEAWSKIDTLKRKLRIPGVQVKWQHPGMSMLEGAMARGDRRMAAVIERAWRLGCTFDGWSDHFKFDRWRQAFEDGGLSIDSFTTRARSTEEPLPWDHMDSRVDANFLKSQWHSAQRSETTDDCRQGHCHQCGVCDFETVKPRRFACISEERADLPEPKFSAASYRQVELIYSKRFHARFFGHLEVSNIFARALRRAKIDVLYSQGFHPMPRISFDDPLPLGMESCAERMWIRVAHNVKCQDLLDRLGRQMPYGFTIVACRDMNAQQPKSSTRPDDRYHLALPASIDEADRIEFFKRQESWPYSRTRKGRSQAIDLKAYVIGLTRMDDQILEMIIHRKSTVGVRPADILRSVWGMDEQGIAMVRVIKQAPAHLLTPMSDACIVE